MNLLSKLNAEQSAYFALFLSATPRLSDGYQPNKRPTTVNNSTSVDESLEWRLFLAFWRQASAKSRAVLRTLPDWRSVSLASLFVACMVTILDR